MLRSSDTHGTALTPVQASSTEIKDGTHVLRFRELLFATTFALACLSDSDQAHEYKAGSLTVGHPWVRTVLGSEVGTGYLTITNTGSMPDWLVGGALTGTARAEVHATSTEGSIVRIRAVEGGLEIKPCLTVKLAPGGYHLMVMDLKGLFVGSELLEGTLEFQRAGTVPVEFEVQPVEAKVPADPTHKH